MTQRTSRLPALLQLFALDKPVTHALVLARLGWDKSIASGALANATAHGFIQKTDTKHEGQVTYKLTGSGKRRLGQVDVATSTDLAGLAIALILASEAGMDSEQLAEKLVSSNEQVIAALAPAADAHRVVACRLVRGGVELMLYRKSVGAPLLSAWGKALAASATASDVTAARARTQAAQGVDIDAAHRVPSTGHIDKLTPPAEPAQPERPTKVDSVTNSKAVEQLADAIVEASEQEAALDAADHEQWFALFSSGELNMQRADGSQISLDADETRALFAWLDRLGGTNLQRLAAAEEATA